MNKNILADICKNALLKIRRFVSSRDLLIFLFFLLVSFGMWTLQAMRKEYETIITVPVRYDNIPDEIAQQSNLPDKIYVTIYDGGLTLLRYRMFDSFLPVVIDASEYEEGDYTISSSQFERYIQSQLNSSTRIQHISPKQINFSFERLAHKRVPVVFKGKIRLAWQFIKCGDPVLEPDSVTVYGTEQNIANVLEAQTVYTELSDVRDTVSSTVQLVTSENVSFSTASVLVRQLSERYTEKVLDVPVQPRNCPLGYRLRTFPLTASVKFNVGLSRFAQLSAEDFSVIADYNLSSESVSGNRIPLSLEASSPLVSHVSFSPSWADYILEKLD